MIEERTPRDDSGKPILDRQDSEIEAFPEPSATGLKTALVVIVLLAVIAAAYGWSQHNATQQLASERAELSASLAQARSQEDALTAKVNALSVAQAQEEAARAQAEAEKKAELAAQTRAQQIRHSMPRAAAAHRAPVDDPRWKQVQNQLGDQQKELTESEKRIAETQANLDQAKSDLEGNLQSARTELGGDIARNHAEVVALQKKGERNIYEFSVDKSKTYHHTGPISIAVRKADSKHEYCDLQMLVDDREISRKHVNLYESIAFYPEGYAQPLELVVNHIGKDSVQGYVSEPKYRSPQLAAAAAPPSTTTAPVNPPAPAEADAKLEHREEATH